LIFSHTVGIIEDEREGHKFVTGAGGKGTAMKKHVEIAKIGAVYEVRLIEKTLLRTRVSHKTVCGGLPLAKSVARSIASNNARCTVKDLTRSGILSE